MNEFHPIALGAETTDVQANTLTRIANAVQYGLPAAGISGALSIANSFLTEEREFDIEQSVRKYDEQAGDYYKDNKSAVDMVGFVAGSILPASLGIKAVQLARSGTALGPVSRALGITASKKNEYLAKALQETAKDGGTVRSILSANRAKHLGWEVADQALLGTAAELAIVGAMNDSPVFDGDSISDFAWNIGLGAGVAGLVGGGLGSMVAKGILSTAGKEVQSQVRLADTVLDPERMGLKKGTETLLFAESIARLPTDFGDLPFNYRYDGKKISTTLETAGALKSAKDRAEQLAREQLAVKFTELAGGNAAVGQGYYELIKSGMKAARESGKSTDEIISLVSGYLNNVDKIGAIDLDQVALDARKFYVSKNVAEATDAKGILAGMFSRKRTPNTSKQAYVLADDVTADNLSIGFFEQLTVPDLKTAWLERPDLDAIRMPDGLLKINPRSEKILRVKELPYRVRQFVDLETGTVTPEITATFGDIIGAQGKWVAATADSIAAGGRTFAQPAHVPFNKLTSPLDASARFAWASHLSVQDFVKKIGTTINVDDLPVLDRLAELISEGKLPDDLKAKLRFVDGDIVSTLDDIPSVQALSEQKKHALLRESLATWGDKDGSVANSQVFAAKLNASRDWVEKSIESGHVVSDRVDDWAMRPTGDAMKPASVAVEWDMGAVPQMMPEDAFNMNMGPSHLVTKALTKEYQLLIRGHAGFNAQRSVLGEDFSNFRMAPKDLAKDADARGAGAGLFTSSNASYGEKARLWVQDTGKAVNLTAKKWRDATVEMLSPSINAIRDSADASAEFAMLTTALRKSEFRYTFDPQSPNRLISTEVAALAAKSKRSVDDILEEMIEPAGRPGHSLQVADPAVIRFLRDSTLRNGQRQDKFTTIMNAAGLTRELPDIPVIYVPPINTVKYPYHAFVRTKEKIGVASDVAMITARTEDQLRKLAAQVGDDFDVFFDKNTDLYFKAKGEYEYAATINESRVDSLLKRRGILSDFYPETRFENVMGDWLEWHAKQEEKLVRDAVQVGNRQAFSELRFLSENYRTVSESVARGIGSKFKSKVADPFGDYIKTALDISKQQEFPLLDSLNEFVDKLGVRAGDALEAIRRDNINGDTDMITAATRANEAAARFGLGMPYDVNKIDDFITANQRGERNIIKEGFQKANLFLATATLRLDFANSLVNIISTPIMLGTEMASIKRLVQEGSAEAGALKELMSVRAPDGTAVPSTTKLIGNAVNNFFGQDKAAHLRRYREIGAIKEVSQLYHDVLDDLSFRGDLNPSKWNAKVTAAVEKGAKLTGNTFAEDFTRFVSADVMRQLSDPLVAANKLSIKEQNAYISTFVNRVQGNYVTSQRPVVFQGTTGAAVSLFQTYAFNVLQQLTRHMQAGDKKTLAVFGGLQATVFGFNGLPFFDAVNTHLIGSMLANNPSHQDAYSVLPGFNKELGDWMLYGTASAFPLLSGSAPALYTRGDINPRHITILPTSPLDVPAVQAAGKLIGTVKEMAKNLMPGSGVPMEEALLKGMEHQGLNRPLAGLAQLLAGRSTTSKGALVSAASDMETTSALGALSERVVNFGGVSRLMGARPMDEAVALNALYRQKTYDALDKERLERLGEKVKTNLYGGKVPEQAELEDFMLRYTRAGGRIENFSQALQRWMRDANESVVNQMAEKLRSPYAAKLQTIMGGEPLPDYTN